jgi:bifunctional ADP-heptose synthase (sugar kinase/adenylyltransferase)
MAMLAAFSCVDYIVPIDEAEAGKAILETVRPHIHANGSEYGSPDTWVEWSAISEMDVVPYVVQRKPNLATTDIIKKIKARPE